jgi:hypothetical protein
MFFEHDKTKLLTSLENTRKGVCLYMGPTCDCKYGGPPEEGQRMGENTGCPELRTVKALIEYMSQEEIDEVLNRQMKEKYDR